MFSQASFKSKNLNPKLSNWSKGKGKADKGPPCVNCAKPGHTKQECWMKGGGAEGTGPRQKKKATKDVKEKAKEENTKTESAKVATTKSSPLLDFTLYALPAGDAQTSPHSWLLNSGASQHMTPNHHWFSTYHPLTTPVLI
ncbi:hypothetical protein OPQ81_000497 [Rhizoctonia solani]|nr:hypothetical protein OPQ81_000497 [Rhizoctonia solani]